MAVGEFWMRSEVHWINRFLLEKMATEDPIKGYDFRFGLDFDDALDLEFLVR